MKKNKPFNYFQYGILLILFVSTLAFCLIPKNSDATTNKKTDEENLYQKAQEKLINGNYEYIYKEYNEDTKVTKIYNGNVTNEENIGYYESNKEVYKYDCKIDKCFKEYTDHEEEFEMVTSKYLNPTYIFQIIKNLNEEIKKDDTSILYIYTSEEENIEIKITLEYDSITNIIIQDQNMQYNLTYN